MRLKTLKFENINSFYGSFEIDFERFYDSLFLISGPTGSGKTTVIDAILAALYNKTPRLKNTRDLINKDSKDAKIELLFSIGADEYMIRWSGKKRKNTEVKRKLFKNDEEIADKDRQIDEIVSNLLKLSFSEFTKAIVLAQGEFDAFLSAKSDEKMRLLESVLDVSEFEKISRGVYKMHKQMENEIGEIQRKIEEIGVSDEDLKQKEKEFSQIQDKFEEKNRALKEIEKKIKLFEEKKRLLGEIEKLKNESESLKNEKSKIDIEKLKNEFEKKEKELSEFEEIYTQNMKLINEDEKRLLEIKNLKKEFFSNEKYLNEKEKLLKKYVDEIKVSEKIKKELEDNLRKIKIFEDEGLRNFDEVNALFVRIFAIRDEYRKIKNQINILKQEIEELKKEILAKEGALKDKKERFEYLGAKIVVLRYENEREKLKDNEPCPLCGSREHPYKTNPPVIEKELQKEYAKLQKEIEKEENGLNVLKNNLNVKEKILSENEKKLNEVMKEGQELKNKLSKYNLSEDEYEVLKQKKEHNEKAKEEIERLKREILRLDEALSYKKEAVKSLKVEAEGFKSKTEEIKKEIERKESELVFEDVGKIKKELEERFELLKREKESKFKKYNESFNKLARIESKHEEFEKIIKNNKKRVSEIDVKDENLYEKKEALAEEINLLAKNTGGLKKEIENIKKELEKKEKHQNEIKEKSKKFKILTNLNRAVGSSDGKKFKQIAINKMIDGLLYTTNTHLKRLSDERYFLIKGEKADKIELDIVDSFYENSKRSVNTLSGGEKFLVSLSLAFGLSDMIRDKVKIDVMFLDEGFGTLDSQNLMKTVEILKKASVGKTIGIISHVDVLKEEIQKGIKVRKKGSGRSDISVY